MLWLLVAVGAGVVAWVIWLGFLREDRPSPTEPAPAPFIVAARATDAPVGGQNEPAPVPTSRAIVKEMGAQAREEILDAIQPHAAAASFLFAVARLDGHISEAERNLIFEYLVGQGCPLGHKRHRSFFRLLYGIEWQRAATEDDLVTLLARIPADSGPSSTALVVAARAIVAVGGQPTSRKLRALDLLTARFPV